MFEINHSNQDIDSKISYYPFPEEGYDTYLVEVPAPHNEDEFVMMSNLTIINKLIKQSKESLILLLITNSEFGGRSEGLLRLLTSVTRLFLLNNE